MTQAEPTRRSIAYAEVLLWQCRFRMWVVVALTASWLIFRLAGLPDPDSVGRRWLGAPWHVVAMLAIAGVYLAFAAGTERWLRRARRVTTALLVGVVVADVAGLFAVLVLVTPLEAYERGLLLSFFSLQLTQLYFGRPLAALSIALMTALYVAALLLAQGAGLVPVWSRELWTLYLYGFGAVGFVALQGSVSARLARIVRMFRRMEEGDFSESYDVTRDRRPDNVTAVGRAYNRMRSQLSTIVLTDTLSGCLNRRGFEDQLAREVARAARSGAPISLLALDVDYFKVINDSFGHLAGDQAIQEIGRLLRDTARSGDVVARIGGEEFMILAPDTSDAGAFNLAQRVADAFRQHGFAAVRGRIPVTASIGVATELQVTDGIGEDLRARADEALYTAKRTGRNRVVVWTQGLQAFTTGTFAAAVANR